MPRQTLGSLNLLIRAQTGLTFVYSDGSRRSISIDLPIDVTPAQLDNLIGAMEDITNAALFERRFTQLRTVTRPAGLLTFDEPYDLSRSLVLVFIVNFVRKYVEVPAPDLSIVNPDGTVDIDNTLVQSLIQQYQSAVPNANFQTAFIATRKLPRKLAPIVVPAPEEPGAGENPPPLPAG